MDGSCGPCWLFFGCRQPAEDFLYEDDLKGFLQDGTLDRLEVAFSRHQSSKVYVQHKMAEFSDKLYKMLVSDEGFVFVCGDGASMAKDVHQCLLRILQSVGGMTEKEASNKLVQMIQQKHYVRDIWS